MPGKRQKNFLTMNQMTNMETITITKEDYNHFIDWIWTALSHEEPNQIKINIGRAIKYLKIQ